MRETSGISHGVDIACIDPLSTIDKRWGLLLVSFNMILDRSIEELLVGGMYFVVILGVHNREVGYPLFLVKHCVWVIDLRSARKTRGVNQIRIFELLRRIQSVFSESGWLIEVLLAITL